MCATLDMLDRYPQTLPNPLEERQRLPRLVSPSENALHLRHRMQIGSLPRSILGTSIMFALQKAFGRAMPNAPKSAAEVFAGQARQSAERVNEIRKELEVPDSVEQLRECVERSEAQGNFEAMLKVKDLQDSLK